MPRNRAKPFAAVDIGGTKILAAVITADNDILARYRVRTQATEGRSSVIERLMFLLEEVMRRAGLAKSDVAGVGIAAAGIIDARRGIVTTSPNLPGWHNVPLRAIAAEKLGLDICLINDASAAALGEQRHGAAIGLDNVIYLTVSTGIGGGIIIGGELYAGADGCAGEIGHMIIDSGGPECACGKSGCLESLASGSAMAREAMKRLAEGEPSVMRGMAKDGTITGELISMAAKQNDKLACEIVAAAAKYLGIGLANLTNVFNPDMIVIGGGLSNMGRMLLVPASRVAKEIAFKLPARRVRIVKARLGADAGVVGAAAYMFDNRR